MGKIAFVFPGQGAQKAGMGLSLYNGSQAARDVFDRLEAIRPGTLNMCFEGSDSELSLTINAQPCVFAVDLACAAALAEAGIAAEGCAGFSLGEMPAAAFSGLMAYEDAFRAVLKRAELAHAASESAPGTMAAVLKLDVQTVERICEAHPGGAFPANYNCPGQTVCALRLEAVDAFEADIKRHGGRMIRLNVSGAFHCALMSGAADEFNDYLSGIIFNKPGILLYSNTTALPYAAEGARGLLSGQMASPVMWEKTIKNMIDSGFDAFIEAGCGNVLTGLIGKIGGAAVSVSVNEFTDIEKAANAIKEAAL